MHDKHGPIGDAEFATRKAAHADGSARLFDAVEKLIERTAERLDVPADHVEQRTAFARAYLGLEVGA